MNPSKSVSLLNVDSLTRIQCDPLISTSAGNTFLCRCTDMAIYRNNGEVRNKKGMQRYFFLNSPEIDQ